MKIALFVHNFPPEFLGGTERVVLALAKSYESMGHSCVVVAGSERFVAGSGVEEEDFEGIRVRRLLRDPAERYGLDLRWPKIGDRVTEVLLDERPDSIHLHHWSTLGWDLMQRATAIGIPGIVTLHDLWTTCPRFFRRPPNGVRCPLGAERDSCVGCVQLELGHPAEEVERGLQRRDEMLMRELRCAQSLTVPSDAQAQLLRRHLPWDKDIVVVPHGLLEPIERRSQPVSKRRPLRVGTFGNLVPDKGCDVLVDALANFGQEVELHLAGSCPDPAYIERLEQRAKDFGLSFEWHGAYQPGAEHPALGLDLAIFPSLCHESYGLVVDEALAHGVPVVVSAKGALPERAARGGVVVKTAGVAPLKVALAGLLRSRRKLEDLRAAIPTVYPSIDEAAKRYEALLSAQEVGS